METKDVIRKTLWNIAILPLSFGGLFLLGYLLSLGPSSGGGDMDMGFIGLAFILGNVAIVFFVLWNLKLIYDLIIYRKSKPFFIANLIVLIIPNTPNIYKYYKVEKEKNYQEERKNEFKTQLIKIEKYNSIDIGKMKTIIAYDVRNDSIFLYIDSIYAFNKPRRNFVVMYNFTFHMNILSLDNYEVKSLVNGRLIDLKNYSIKPDTSYEGRGYRTNFLEYDNTVVTYGPTERTHTIKNEGLNICDSITGIGMSIVKPPYYFNHRTEEDRRLNYRTFTKDKNVWLTFISYESRDIYLCRFSSNSKTFYSLNVNVNDSVHFNDSFLGSNFLGTFIERDNAYIICSEKIFHYKIPNSPVHRSM